MASITDVAAYILENLGSVSTMKLQKLAFYSQAHHGHGEHAALAEDGLGDVVDVARTSSKPCTKSSADEPRSAPGRDLCTRLRGLAVDGALAGAVGFAPGAHLVVPLFQAAQEPRDYLRGRQGRGPCPVGHPKRPQDRLGDRGDKHSLEAMTMMVSLDVATADFNTVQERLTATGETLGMQVLIQPYRAHRVPPDSPEGGVLPHRAGHLAHGGA